MKVFEILFLICLLIQGQYTSQVSYVRSRILSETLSDNESTKFPLVFFKYMVQKPYDVKQEERFQIKDGIYEFTVYSTDKSFRQKSITRPRTEMRIKNDYESGIQKFEAEFYVVSGTSGVSIFQIFGATGKPSAFQLRVYDGALENYRGDTLADKVYDRWIPLVILHNVKTHKIKVIVDDKPPIEVNDKGEPSNSATGYYFKVGLWVQDTPSTKMEVKYRNMVVSRTDTY
jgi:hypothetical protein